MGAEPLHALLSEINRAAKGGFPFLAVAMTVALPDICVSLASADGRSGDRKRYKDWCEANLGAEFAYVTADDLYSMRCGVLHTGRFGDLKHNVARVVFALPGAKGFTNSKINDAYVYSVGSFCENFTKAVAAWFEKHKNDATVQANLPRLIAILPPRVFPRRRWNSSNSVTRSRMDGDARPQAHHHEPIGWRILPHPSGKNVLAILINRWVNKRTLVCRADLK